MVEQNKEDQEEKIPLTLSTKIQKLRDNKKAWIQQDDVVSNRINIYLGIIKEFEKKVPQSEEEKKNLKECFACLPILEARSADIQKKLMEIDTYFYDAF